MSLTTPSTIAGKRCGSVYATPMFITSAYVGSTGHSTERRERPLGSVTMSLGKASSTPTVTSVNSAMHVSSFSSSRASTPP